MVGRAEFELAVSWSQTRLFTELSHRPPLPLFGDAHFSQRLPSPSVAVHHGVELAAPLCESCQVDILIRCWMSQADGPDWFVAIWHSQLAQGLVLSIEDAEVDGAHAKVGRGEQDQHDRHRSVELPVGNRPQRLVRPPELLLF